VPLKHINEGINNHSTIRKERCHRCQGRAPHDEPAWLGFDSSAICKKCGLKHVFIVGKGWHMDITLCEELVFKLEDSINGDIPRKTYI
jgi:hypothetical protein